MNNFLAKLKQLNREDRQDRQEFVLCGLGDLRGLKSSVMVKQLRIGISGFINIWRKK